MSTISNPDYPALLNGKVVEMGLAKYDGVRAYYAGCPKPCIYGSTSSDNSSGSMSSGTYHYQLIGKYTDAKGRVVYSDPLYFTITLAVGHSGVNIPIQCSGLQYGTLGYGTGATLTTNGGSGGATSTNLTCRVPHGVQPGDMLYYYETSVGNVAGNRAKVFNNTTEVMLNRRVSSVRGVNVVITQAVTTFVDIQRFVANKTILICRSKAGGTSSTVYITGEIPYPDFCYWDGYDGSANNEYFTFRDDLNDSSLTEQFDLPGIGFEWTRTRTGTAMTLHGGRICVARGGNIYWSNPDAGRSSIEHTPLTNSINIGGTSGGRVTALASSGDESLYAFRSNGIYRVSGEFYGQNGLPTLRQSTVIENDLGAGNNRAVISFGGVLLAQGSGTIYSIKDGVIYTEIGRALTEKLKGVSTKWRSYFYADAKNQQVKVWCVREGSVADIYPQDSFCAVLDLKNSDDNTDAQDDIVLSRSIFNGAWFPWKWALGAPTSGSVKVDDLEYYISNRTPLLAVPSGNLDTIRTHHQNVCGLYVGVNEGFPDYRDAGKAIRNVVNFTPIHKGQYDQEKAWVSFKLFRLLNNSDLPFATSWEAVVDLIFGLSSNALTLDTNILKLTSSVGFSNTADTQAICPISGNYSPALEIKITVEELYKAISFSSIILDYFEPFDVEGQRYTSED